MPKVRNARTRFLNRGEVEILLEEIKKRSTLWHDISHFALLTGLRANEIFTLSVSRVDSSSNFINIYDGKSINRAVPLCTTAKMIIASYLNGKKTQALVFPRADGNPIRTVSNTYFRSVAACKFNEGVTDYRQKVVFHTLRHTFASWLVQKGTPLATVPHLLGHRSIDMTMRYAHLAPEYAHDAVERLWNQ